MKQVIFKTIFPVIILIMTQLFPVFGDGEGFLEFNWEDIKQVKGGARKCIINTVDATGYFPETEAFFDQKGRLIQLNTGYSVQKFFYDKNGLSEIEHGADDDNGAYTVYGKTLYDYDSRGKLVKIASVDMEGNEYMSEEGITYDKKGNIRIERLTPEGSVYKVDTYNSSMDLIESVVYTGESVAMGFEKKEIESKTTVKYDKNNNIAEKVIEYITVPIENMPKKITISFKYDYDQKGNKTLMKTTLSPEKAAEMFPDLLRPPVKFRYTFEEEKPPKAADSSLKINQKVSVLWEGSWYPAVILKQDGNKYLIHYVDYDSSWDEWVLIDRIKP